jgi:hypothetical protein
MIIGLVSVSLATAAPAPAADTIVTTVAKPTTIDAFGGRAVWSTWDPAQRVYRLTEYSGGAVRTLPVAANAVPFDVDLGPGAGGGTVAVYSRCRKPPAATFALNGRRGCDLRAFRFATNREVRLTRANSPADEYWPTIWRGRLAFSRTYGIGHQVLYWRKLTGKGRSHRLGTGPRSVESAAVDEELDMRGRRVAFAQHLEYGGSLRITSIGGRGRVLVSLPGSGAADNELDAQGPAISGDSVRWGYVVAGSRPAYTEIRRVSTKSGAEQRATTRLDAAGDAFTPTSGFGFFGGVVWYVRQQTADAFEVHRADGLTYEAAPPPHLR